MNSSIADEPYGNLSESGETMLFLTLSRVSRGSLVF